MDIVAAGMVCSVGLTAATACAAMRAKVAGFDELPYVDNEGEPIVGAAVPDLDPGLKRGERLVELLALALEDCLASTKVGATARVPLLVGLAEFDRPGGAGGFAKSLIPKVEVRLDTKFDRNRSETFPRGHVSGFDALRKARELLQDRAVPACLVCGVDSYINASSLQWLDRHNRLKTPANSDGVIPGEAAACVLVVRPEPEPREGCVARVAGLGFGREEASVMTEEPLLGLGLAAAGRAALGQAGLTMKEIDLRLSDVGGESYGFREQTLMLCRLVKEHQEFTPLWHIAESIGETGAASGIGQLVVVQQAFRKRYAPGGRVLCATSADNGDRAVALLDRQLSGKAVASVQTADARDRTGVGRA
jgi:3-oxoacyl-[acyl-carrier-protein] synthase-1